MISAVRRRARPWNTLSTNWVLTKTKTSVYSTFSSGNRTAASTSTRALTIIAPVPTVMPNSLFRTTEMISEPPLDPYERSRRAAPTPDNAPAITAQSIGSAIATSTSMNASARE